MSHGKKIKQDEILFKYRHNTCLDLSKYGIYKTGEKVSYIEPSFILALRNGGLSDDKIRLIYKIFDLPTICNLIKAQIHIKTIDCNNGKRCYGEGEEIFNIGYIEGHYFIIDCSNCNSYAIKHYGDLKYEPEFNKIYGSKNRRYMRDEKRYIDSFALIKLLLAQKSTLLSEIPTEEYNIMKQQSFTAQDSGIYKEFVCTEKNLHMLHRIADICSINDDTALIGISFPTIGDLKMCTDTKKVILYITHLKPGPIKDYLDNWIYDTYYSLKRLRGNLTDRIKEINNGICYNQIMRKCFSLYDIKNNMSSHTMLENKAINYVKELHSICSSMCGSFIDYLIRRIICDLTGEPFSDRRATRVLNTENSISYYGEQDNIWTYIKNDDISTWSIRDEPILSSKTVGEIRQQDSFMTFEKKDEWIKIKHNNIIGWIRWKIPVTGPSNNVECTLNNMVENKYIQHKKGNTHICLTGCKYEIEQTVYFSAPEKINSCSLPICQNISYNKMRDTAKYKSKDILYDIFAVSLCHTESFGFCPKQDTFETFMNTLKTNNVDDLVNPLTEMCKSIIQNKTNIILNPALGGPLELSGISIPSDADLIIDDTVIDIKCTKTSKSTDYYEILQLLGYSGLLLLNKKYQQKINNMMILNILEGTCKIYNIGYLEKYNFVKYIKLLSNIPI
jgi:hypothetical protein